MMKEWTLSGISRVMHIGYLYVYWFQNPDYASFDSFFIFKMRFFPSLVCFHSSTYKSDNSGTTCRKTLYLETHDDNYYRQSGEDGRRGDIFEYIPGSA